ncbi:hypothetical protein ACO0LF_06990 [Undibacterium sp. Di27W]|uniref:hypothetical protein n=1 Tax=Undibacterium sp. Di27W TaxID=3413036 RepID=UPI003BF43CED
MTLIKRQLTEAEFLKLDFQGIELQRRPSPEALWVVDEERQLLCVQLISTTYAMREGYYWYLLLLEKRQFIFMVDAFSAKTKDEQREIEAVLDNNIAVQDIATAKALAVEAIHVLTNEKLLFVDKAFYSSM